MQKVSKVVRCNTVDPDQGLHRLHLFITPLFRNFPGIVFYIILLLGNVMLLITNIHSRGESFIVVQH